MKRSINTAAYLLASTFVVACGGDFQSQEGSNFRTAGKADQTTRPIELVTLDHELDGSTLTAQLGNELPADIYVDYCGLKLERQQPMLQCPAICQDDGNGGCIPCQGYIWVEVKGMCDGFGPFASTGSNNMVRPFLRRQAPGTVLEEQTQIDELGTYRIVANIGQGCVDKFGNVDETNCTSVFQITGGAFEVTTLPPSITIGRHGDEITANLTNTTDTELFVSTHCPFALEAFDVNTRAERWIKVSDVCVDLDLPVAEILNNLRIGESVNAAVTLSDRRFYRITATYGTDCQDPYALVDLDNCATVETAASAMFSEPRIRPM